MNLCMLDVALQVMVFMFLSSLTKDFTVRPHYSELLEHPLIKEFEVKPVDVGAWLRDVEKTVGL